MQHPPITVDMAVVQGMLSAVRRIRSNDWIVALVARCDIPCQLLDHPRGRVTGEQYVRLFRKLMDELDDECLGHMSRPMRRGSFALVTRTTCGAPNIRVALHRIAQSLDLLGEDLRVQVVQSEQALGLSWSTRGSHPQPQNFLYEMLMRVVWRLVAWLHGGRLIPLRFDFSFPRPHYADIYREIFPGLLVFDQTSSTIWFDRAQTEQSIHRTPNDLERFLQGSPGNVILPWLGERATSTRAYSLLRLACPHWPDLNTAARSLHLAPSTLQRHLAQEGTSFQALKDKLRRDLAITLLSTTDKPLSAIAIELGFSDSATFQRAFKGWTGSSAGHYRKCSMPSHF